MATPPSKSVSEFKELTGCDDSIAQYFLHEAQGNLEQAISNYFSESSSQPTNAHRNTTPSTSVSSSTHTPVPSAITNSIPVEERYRACMLLAGAGDAIGTIHQSHKLVLQRHYPCTRTVSPTYLIRIQRRQMGV
jgi:hypothetical protein